MVKTDFPLFGSSLALIPSGIGFLQSHESTWCYLHQHDFPDALALASPIFFSAFLNQQD